MPGVTQEQIRAAKQIRAIDFLLQYRPDDIVPSQCRGEYQLQSHDSFKISGETSLWHWKSRDIGGKSALDYLIHVEGMRFTEAVLLLLEQTPTEVRPTPVPRQMPEPKVFALPEAAPDNRRVYAYLLHRGIDRQIINDCIRAGVSCTRAPGSTMLCLWGGMRQAWRNMRFCGGRLPKLHRDFAPRWPAVISGTASVCLRSERADGWLFMKPPLRCLPT